MTQTASTGGALTADERKADLTIDQLKQLVGLVPYDETRDPFPVRALDAVVFAAGNATQTAKFYQLAFGMDLVAYSGPETGVRDRKAYVLKSGSARFVVSGGVTPDSPLLNHHRRHGALGLAGTLRQLADGGADLLDLGVGELDGVHVGAVRALVDDRAHEVGQVRDVAHGQPLDVGQGDVITDRASRLRAGEQIASRRVDHRVALGEDHARPAFLGERCGQTALL